MAENKEQRLGELIDNDKGLIKSRRILMTLSILLLVSTLGGVTIKEANTLIFKLELSNPSRLNFLLFAAVFFCTIRYYSFAVHFHKKIKKIWCYKLLEDEGVFKIAPPDQVKGLLGKKINIIPSDRPSIEYIEYKTEFFLKRSIFLSERVDSEAICHHEENYSLSACDDQWSRRDFFQLLKLELKYRLETLLQNREYLDILFPYYVAIFSLAFYLFMDFNILTKLS